jgi:hypothetical protein
MKSVCSSPSALDLDSDNFAYDVGIPMKLFGDVSRLYISEYYYCMFTFWKLCLIGKCLTPWRDYSSLTSETASSKQSCRLSHYQSRLVALSTETYSKHYLGAREYLSFGRIYGREADMAIRLHTWSSVSWPVI